MARPIVGITAFVTPAQFGGWSLHSVLVPADYVRAVESAGGRALLVPPADEGIEETLGALDALILSGGADLAPALYGQEPHPETKIVEPERDSAELSLLRAALDRDMPVLAICRGSQVLNVLLGGDLVQHLPDVVGHDGHKLTPGSFVEHDIGIELGTQLDELMGGGQQMVPSHHHQGIGNIGEGLRVAARAADGSVEAIEDPSRRFAVGVLWHPEAGEDWRLFQGLVAEAARYRAEQGR